MESYFEIYACIASSSPRISVYCIEGQCQSQLSQYSRSVATGESKGRWQKGTLLRLEATELRVVWSTLEGLQWQRREVIGIRDIIYCKPGTIRRW